MKLLLHSLPFFLLLGCASFSQVVMEEGGTRSDIPEGDLCIQGDSLIVGRTPVMLKYGIREVDRMDGNQATLGGVLGWFGGELIGALLGTGVGTLRCPKDDEVDEGLGSEEGWCKVGWMMGGAIAFAPIGAVLGSEGMGRTTTPLSKIPSCEL